MNPHFKSALDATRSSSEQTEIVDELFARLERAIQMNPDHFKIDLVVYLVHAKKIGD